MKDPKTVHNDSSYNSKKKKTDKELIYYWDPRPQQFRGVNILNMNKFVLNLEKYAEKNEELLMWLTLLKVQYDDFTLENCDIQSYHQLFHQFKENNVIEIKNISDLVTAGQIPNTQEQGNSDTWISQLYKFCEDKLWFRQNITTLGMLYGIKEEPKARTSYNKVTGSVVQESGLWVNVNYPWLGASPEGLILNSENVVIGLIEIKCLKIFRTRTVEEVVDQHNKKIIENKWSMF